MIEVAQPNRFRLPGPYQTPPLRPNKRSEIFELGVSRGAQDGELVQHRHCERAILHYGYSIMLGESFAF